MNDIKSTSTFSHFPNPVKGDDFTVKDDSEIEKIIIYNLTGEKIKEQKGNLSTQQTVNIKELSAGYYIVNLVLADGKIDTFKLIKE